MVIDKDGRVAERFNATVLKTVVGSRPPLVRISPLPPRIPKAANVMFAALFF